LKHYPGNGTKMFYHLDVFALVALLLKIWHWFGPSSVQTLSTTTPQIPKILKFSLWNSFFRKKITHFLQWQRHKNCTLNGKHWFWECRIHTDISTTFTINHSSCSLQTKNMNSYTVAHSLCLSQDSRHSYSVGLFTLFSSHGCSCTLAPRKSFDILPLYKSDYYYYYYFTLGRSSRGSSKNYE